MIRELGTLTGYTTEKCHLLFLGGEAGGPQNTSLYHLFLRPGYFMHLRMQTDHWHMHSSYREDSRVQGIVSWLYMLAV